MILADQSADPMVDFNTEMLDVVPTANAEMSSKMHRIQTAQLELEQLPNVIQTGGNGAYILKNYFGSIGSDVEQIYPEEGSMSPEDKKMQQQMLQQQEQANAIAKQNSDILAREQDRLDQETAMKIQGMQGEQDKLKADIRKIDAETDKLLTEAQVDPGLAQEKSLNRAVDLARMSGEMDLKLENLQIDKAMKAKQIQLLDEKIQTEKAKRSSGE